MDTNKKLIKRWVIKHVKKYFYSNEVMDKVNKPREETVKAESIKIFMILFGKIR